MNLRSFLLAVAFLAPVNASCPPASAGAVLDGEERPDFWRLIEGAVETGELAGATGVVLEHMAAVVDLHIDVPHRTSRVKRAVTEPWTPPEIARELRDLLAQPMSAKGAPDFAGLLRSTGSFIDLDFDLGFDDEGLLEDMEITLEWLASDELKDVELLEALGTFMSQAHRALEVALAELEPEQREQLFAEALDFREAWYRSHFPNQELSDELTEILGRWVELLREADHDHTLALAVADRVSRLAAPEFLKSLSRRLRRVKKTGAASGFGGDIRTVVGTSDANRVVLGGKRASTYTGHAALVIDLGGDDRYERAAVVDSPTGLVSVVLDLGGDDTYTGVCARATGGLALLVDVEGSDSYTSKRLSQSAATFGVAWLCDLEGDDHYVAEDYAQGHAVSGTALLYDIEGDDRYEAWAFAQGGGLGPGFCALIDGAGDDRYLADLAWPDVYGNSGPEIYHGASQGYSTGIRSGGSVAGGIAALLDLGDGSDRYQAGSFSQGGAYYFAFGLMYDDGGDDENFGARYSQGFGVHQAAAVRWDRSGDDRYTCRSVAHTGMAWDEGVGYFLEDEGDDVYKVGGLGLGGAAQTGIAIAIDLDGEDEYVSGGQSQGGTGSSEYHHKPALGVLLDLGGDKDVYSLEGRANDTLHFSGEIGIFLDSQAKSLESAAKQIRD
jgi:hypothetical protein